MNVGLAQLRLTLVEVVPTDYKNGWLTFRFRNEDDAISFEMSREEWERLVQAVEDV